MVRANGRRCHRTTRRLVLLTLCNLALGGNVRAVRYYSEILAKYAPQQPAGTRLGYLVVPAPMTPDEWIAEQLELNKSREPPPGYTPKALRGRDDSP